jgi:hypothetical protein
VALARGGAVALARGGAVALARGGAVALAWALDLGLGRQSCACGGRDEEEAKEMSVCLRMNRSGIGRMTEAKQAKRWTHAGRQTGWQANKAQCHSPAVDVAGDECEAVGFWDALPPAAPLEVADVDLEGPHAAVGVGSALCAADLRTGLALPEVEVATLVIHVYLELAALAAVGVGGEAGCQIQKI